MYLGNDLGAPEVKQLLLGDDGRIVGQADTPPDVARPQPQWAEQSSEAWWQATESAVDPLRATQPDGPAALQSTTLAWMAAGGEETTVCAKPEMAARFEPTSRRHGPPHERLQRFREICQRLKPLPATRDAA